MWKILEIVVGCTLLFSGLLHLANPYQFAGAMAAYEIVPLPSLWILAFLLPSTMIALGVSLVSNVCIDAARIGAIVVFAGFAIAQLSAWTTGKQIGCGCFGYSHEPISLFSMSIPILCDAICIANVFTARNRVHDLPQVAS